MRCTVALALVLAAVGCTSKVKGTDDLGIGGNGTDDMGSTCGNGVIDTNEDCDDGAANGTVGDPCTQFCQFVCAVDVNCDDGKACNGAEKCVDHVCQAGTPLDDGASCGSAMLCRSGTCVASRCGDGITTAPEECDDGNVTDGDGCNSDCTYSCKSGDATRNCTPTDACQGQGTCNDTTHVCAPGTPLGDGMGCGTGNDYCKMGHCTMPVCGNGMKEPGEDCDDGGLNGTKNDGCTTMCKFACVNPATDCGAPPVCEKFSCTAGHVCLAVPDAAQNGMACGSMLVCKDGACASASAVCGNGLVETGEDCDFGTGNGPNTGCEASTCKFSCANAAACADGNVCNGTETCDPVTVGSAMGQKCNAGTALADGTACDVAKVCKTKVCQPSTCGDGVIDGRAPGNENCDPPGSIVGGKTCDSKCHLIDCGNGRLEDTEQCDDSNLVNLDGCDNKCKFEQEQRANSLNMSFDTTVCSPNALGGAIQDPTNTAQKTLQMSIDTGIKDGSMTVAMKFLGLDDLTGTSSTAPFSVGVLHGSPVSATGYDGTNDLDWWYTTDAMSIDGMRNPLSTLPNGKFAAGKLTAGPGTLELKLVLGGSPASLTMYKAQMSGSSTTPTKPTQSTNGMTPGHLSSENDLATMKTFPSLGGGKLCGNISARSLYGVVAPMALQTNCDEAYTATNTLFDALVIGCHKTVGFCPFCTHVTVIAPTQPDGSIDNNTYHFTHTGTSVNGCTGGAAWPACLDEATYSSAFQFTADRVIAK